MVIQRLKNAHDDSLLCYAFALCSVIHHGLRTTRAIALGNNAVSQYKPTGHSRRSIGWR